MDTKLSQVFQSEPFTWGLRGDSFLWREMKEVLSDQAFPETEADFRILLEETFKTLTGKSVWEQENIYIEKYSHGGMSSGYVSPQFWLETGIPLLIERYRETKL